MLKYLEYDNMKKMLITQILLAIFAMSPAQTWNEVKKSQQDYLTGEGWGETIDEADQQALASLISKLSIVVSSNFELLEGEERDGSSEDYKKYIESKVNTYSNATLTNTETCILSNEPDAHVVRWIKRSEIEKIFEGRKAKVIEYLGNAEKGEAKGRIDDALRNYYWAYTLLKTLQHPSDVKYATNNGEEHLLVSWLPEKINEIFESITVSVISREGDDVELYFSYKDSPITSIDYTYFDGGRWSNLYSAKDGKGILELAPGAPGENIQLKIEFAYKNEAHIDREIYSVISVVKSASFRKSYITIKGNPDNSKAKAVQVAEKATNDIATATLAKLEDESHVRSTMKKIVSAIRSKQYQDVKALFTTDGLEMYNGLISYGNARIIGEPTYTIYKYGERVVVRSIPMSFSFSNGTKKSFVEDIVFVFNSAGQIESLAFALDDVATKDILTKQAWPEHARMAIIEFLGNYKTAFALERLDYIRTIFDDNAVIIVGKLAKVSTSIVPEDMNMINNQIVIRTQYTKEQYLKNLERCFESNEFVNIRFANNDVIKAGKGGEVYGIQIKQDYYSTNYGDTGYLFLMVDINDPQAPMIKVRTWQPEPDPVDGLFDISHF
jgi:hypothetical protein